MTAVTHDLSRRAPSAPDTGHAEMAARYREVRSLTENLAAPLTPEDQTIQSMPDVSPTKWHRAHTSWFFETFLLGPFRPGYQVFHPDYAFLFNSYYEAAGPRYAREIRGCVSRPGCAEIASYRGHVDEAMRRLFDDHLEERSHFLVELGLHHEQQHQELLLMDIKHVLAMSPLDPAYLSAPPRPDAVDGQAARWIDHPGGLVAIGHDGGGFAYDNEGPAHEVLLRPFGLADRHVTCGDWLEFMADGGYRRPELWLSDGWAAVKASSWDAPLYWSVDPADPQAWTMFTLGGRRPVDAAEPVCHVSYYEADAYATWCGARLPTEFEWEAVARSYPVAGRFLETGATDIHPRPQDSPALFGDTWVWTSSAYAPYPGFRPAAGAVGEYNGKFMVNQQVLRGGSCITPVGHTRATYRNFYPPSARWPFAGVRLAQDG